MIASVDDAILQRAAAVLEGAGYHSFVRVLEGLEEPVLIVESPYLVALLLAAERWSEAETTVSAAQVALANWTSPIDRSSRRWDLYVVTFLRRWPETPEEGAGIERAEASTEQVRKIIRSKVASEADVPRALRPLLPLLPVGRAALPEPASALEERLRVHGIDPEVAAEAVAGFLQNGVVRL